MNVQKSSTAPAPRATDAAVRAAMGELETSVNDLTLMMGLVTTFFEDMTNGPSTKVDGALVTIRISSDEFDQLAFGIYNVSGRARRLKDDFYAAVEGKAVAS